VLRKPAKTVRLQPALCRVIASVLQTTVRVAPSYTVNINMGLPVFNCNYQRNNVLLFKGQVCFSLQLLCYWWMAFISTSKKQKFNKYMYVTMYVFTIKESYFLVSLRFLRFLPWRDLFIYITSVKTKKVQMKENTCLVTQI